LVGALIIGATFYMAFP